MIKSIFNKIVSHGKILKNERSSNEEESFLFKYAHEKDKARYKFARKFIEGDRILNIACGEGHGSFILSQDNNATIFGVDKSEKAINFAKNKFGNKKLKFEMCDVYKTSFENNFFPTIVSIETIEHLPDHDNFLLEIRGKLKKGGIFIISSPDKIVEDKFFDNPHHINLLYKKDMLALLKKYFEVKDIYCQNPIITKPSFMNYISFIFSSVFLSKKIVKDRSYITGTNYIFICRKT